jgi:hypothetical protein
MKVTFSKHARVRMRERRVTRREVLACLDKGSKVRLGQGRTRFRRTFPVNRKIGKRVVRSKRVDAVAVRRGADWHVVTVMVAYL